MKKLFLPFALVLVAGCGSQQSSQTSDAVPEAPPAPNAAKPADAKTAAGKTGATPAAKAPAKPAATPTAAKATAAPAAAPAKPTAAETGCPAPAKIQPKKTAKYRVVSEIRPGMPPELAKALKAVQLAPPPASFKVPNDARVQLQTSKGNITVQLDTKGAPLHARSFYYLASKGFFDGTTFHRWADLLEGSGKPGYIIQGGDPLTRNPATRQFAGGGGPGYQIPREHNGLAHNAMMLAAARTNDPDSAGSQFYITQNPVCFLDNGDGYTVFGRVVGGQDVALKLVQDDILKKAMAR